MHNRVREQFSAEVRWHRDGPEKTTLALVLERPRRCRAHLGNWRSPPRGNLQHQRQGEEEEEAPDSPPFPASAPSGLEIRAAASRARGCAAHVGAAAECAEVGLPGAAGAAGAAARAPPPPRRRVVAAVGGARAPRGESPA